MTNPVVVKIFFYLCQQPKLSHIGLGEPRYDCNGKTWHYDLEVSLDCIFGNSQRYGGLIRVTIWCTLWFGGVTELYSQHCGVQFIIINYTGCDFNKTMKQVA